MLAISLPTIVHIDKEDSKRNPTADGVGERETAPPPEVPGTSKRNPTADGVGERETAPLPEGPPTTVFLTPSISNASFTPPPSWPNEPLAEVTRPSETDTEEGGSSSESDPRGPRDRAPLRLLRRLWCELRELRLWCELRELRLKDILTRCL